jgi:putative addiction module component (TIGR02574 family)
VNRDAVIEAVFKLSPAEKLQLVHDLWDDLAANPEDVPVYDWQLEELERRRADHESHPELATTWEEALRRARGEDDG